jgi:hypothetical protein
MPRIKPFFVISSTSKDLFHADWFLLKFHVGDKLNGSLVARANIQKNGGYVIQKGLNVCRFVLDKRLCYLATCGGSVSPPWRISSRSARANTPLIFSKHFLAPIQPRLRLRFITTRLDLCSLLPHTIQSSIGRKD